MSQVILSIGAFGVVVVLSRFLGKEAFGEIRYIVAILAILSLFSLPGANSIILQSTASMGKRRLLEIVKTQFMWSLIASFGALCFSLFYFLRDNNSLGYGFLIGGIFAPLVNQYQTPGHIFAGLRNFKNKTLVDGAIIFGIISGAILGIFLTHSVPGVLFFYFLTQSIVTSIFLVYAFKYIPKENTDNGTLSLDIMHSKQLTIFHATFTLLPALEKVFIFLLLGSSSLAIFTIAVLPIDHMRSVFRSFLQFSVLPHFGSGDRYNISIKKWVITASILTFGGVIVLLVFIKFILPIFFPQYLGTIPLSLVLLLALIPIPIQILALSLIASRKIKDLLLYSGSLTMVSIATFLAFMPTFGLMGAMVAKVVTEFLTAILLVIFYKNSKEKVTSDF